MMRTTSHRSSAYVLSSLLLCALAWSMRSPAQSTNLVITEGRYIGYPSVAAALAALQSEGITAVPGLNGDLSFVEQDRGTAWTFVAKNDPAYPTAVRYVYTRSSGELHAELTILCEASAERCAQYRSGIRDNLAQLSKKMAGDPSADCRVNDGTMKCGAEPGAQP